MCGKRPKNCHNYKSMWSKRQYSGQNGHNMAKRQKLPKIIKMCPRREIMVKIVKKNVVNLSSKLQKMPLIVKM